jgi:YD repeat-containing protein
LPFLLDKITEPGNRILTFQHDGSGNLKQLTDVDSTTRTFNYDTAHHLTEDQWAPLDALFSYDPSSGLLTSVNRGLGTTYRITPAAAIGLSTAGTGAALASITDGLNHTTKYQVDLRGRLLEQIQADGTFSSNVRDSAGQVTLSIDALGRPTFSTYAYGAYNQTLGGGNGDLVQVQYADGSRVQYQYDSTFHHLSKTIDQLGRRRAT